MHRAHCINRQKRRSHFEYEFTIDIVKKAQFRKLLLMNQSLSVCLCVRIRIVNLWLWFGLKYAHLIITYESDGLLYVTGSNIENHFTRYV